MRENRKAVPGDCSTENGSGQMSFDGVRIPAQDYITAFEPAQGTIASVLHRGRGKALTCREISRMTGLTRRGITLQVNFERKHGAPILSDSSGFWIADNEAELMECIRRLHARAGEIHATARALERSIRSGGVE